MCSADNEPIKKMFTYWQNLQHPNCMLRERKLAPRFFPSCYGIYYCRLLGNHGRFSISRLEYSQEILNSSCQTMVLLVCTYSWVVNIYGTLKAIVHYRYENTTDCLSLVFWVFLLTSIYLLIYIRAYKVGSPHGVISSNSNRTIAISFELIPLEKISIPLSLQL